LNEFEKALLAEVIGDQEPELCLRTKTRIDAGFWWRCAPIWLCVSQDELILLAVGKRRYLQRVALSECSGSLYCHATAELVIAPVKGLETNRLAVSPAEALRFLSMMGEGYIIIEE
jgi:hypothetical protein